MLLPAIVSGDVLLNHTTVRNLPRRHWPLALIGLLWFAMTYGWLARSVGGAVRSIDVQLLTQAKAVGYYVMLLVMPSSLNVEPQFHVEHGLSAVSVAGALAALSAAAVTWTLAGARGRFLLALAGLWALPTTIMPLNVLVNERRAYMLVAVACIGVGMAWKGRTP